MNAKQKRGLKRLLKHAASPGLPLKMALPRPTAGPRFTKTTKYAASEWRLICVAAKLEKTEPSTFVRNAAINRASGIKRQHEAATA